MVGFFKGRRGNRASSFRDKAVSNVETLENEGLKVCTLQMTPAGAAQSPGLQRTPSNLADLARSVSGVRCVARKLSSQAFCNSKRRQVSWSYRHLPLYLTNLFELPFLHVLGVQEQFMSPPNPTAWALPCSDTGHVVAVDQSSLKPAVCGW